jgi:hypothetical protein
MQRDLGRMDMVHWQGRRLAPEVRLKLRIVKLALAFAVAAALSLMAGFYSGLPVPISLLQSVFAMLMAALLAFAAWSLASSAAHRGDRARISGYRR